MKTLVWSWRSWLSGPLARSLATRNPVAGERRQAARVPCQLEVEYHAISLSPASAGKCELRDVSASGAAMVCSCRYDPGTLLEIELRNPQRQSSFKRLWLITHGRPADSQSWILGGPFYTELSADELETLCRQ